MDDVTEKIAQAREKLGKRRFRIAILYFVRNYTQRRIARSMKISQQFVSKELKKIQRQFSELCERFRADEWSGRSIKLGLTPSLD